MGIDKPEDGLVMCMVSLCRPFFFLFFSQQNRDSQLQVYSEFHSVVGFTSKLVFSIMIMIKRNTSHNEFLQSKENYIYLLKLQNCQYLNTTIIKFK